MSAFLSACLSVCFPACQAACLRVICLICSHVMKRKMAFDVPLKLSLASFTLLSQHQGRHSRFYASVNSLSLIRILFHFLLPFHIERRGPSRAPELYYIFYTSNSHICVHIRITHNITCTIHCTHAYTHGQNT